LLALQDRERRLLACEIHDGFVQEVVGAQIAINALLDKLLESDPESVESLLRIRAMIRKAIDEARGLVSELQPPNVDNLHLAEALQHLVHHEETQRRLDIQLTHSLTIETVDPLLQSTVIRIVQEALNNVAWHAKTKKASVDVEQRGKAIRVVIADDGAGFDPRQVPPGRFGLAGIRERARLLGGKASIRSRPGKGTRVSVELPMEPVLE
jgi:two-component system sensor histidine kinase DegS